MGTSAATIASESVRVTNPAGAGRYVVICEHASNFIPNEFGALGLPVSELTRHIAWDPGALPVARRLAERLDAVLVESRVSRLMIDCNRPVDASDLIPETSEATKIPGNRGLSAGERQARLAMSHMPFHAALDEVIATRIAVGRETLVVTVHSFTPVYKGEHRPWQIGVIHDDDVRLAQPLIAALKAEKRLSVGVNQPYSPADLVYYTLERHARARGLPCVMIEIRNDEIAVQAQQDEWADRVAGILAVIEVTGQAVAGMGA